MANVCAVTGKKAMSGHKVSHSNIKTKRKFEPNLQVKRFYDPETKKWVSMKLSASAIRTINKKGLGNVLRDMKAKSVAH